MKRAHSFLIVAALCFGVLALAVFCGQCQSAGKPDPVQTVETINGNTRTIDRIDSDGNRHGLQQIYVDGVLVHESRVDHGQVLEITEWNPDGSVKFRSRENAAYDMERN